MAKSKNELINLISFFVRFISLASPSGLIQVYKNILSQISYTQDIVLNDHTFVGQ